MTHHAENFVRSGKLSQVRQLTPSHGNATLVTGGARKG
jgi:hypothetical protein